MSVIQRPGKEGNATTYQGKVAAGYTKILAAEVDADLDTIYSAWNAGIDTVNIKDGSISGAKLAPGAVGTRELADGGVATVDLADAAVTTPKIADGAVTDGKVTSVGFNKLAGGAVNGSLPLTPRTLLLASAGVSEWDINTPNSPAYDNTKPSWIVRVDYSSAVDNFIISRAPPPGTVFQPQFAVFSNGVIVLPAGSITRPEIAVNAVVGASAAVAAPVSFVLTTPAVWTPVATLPSITTRGGWVHLRANHCLSVSGPGGNCNQRWLRDGTHVTAWSFVTSTPNAFAPFPGITYLDAAPAGAHVYQYQVLVDNGCGMVSTPFGDGLFQAVEIG